MTLPVKEYPRPGLMMDCHSRLLAWWQETRRVLDRDLRSHSLMMGCELAHSRHLSWEMLEKAILGHFHYSSVSGKVQSL